MFVHSDLQAGLSRLSLNSEQSEPTILHLVFFVKTCSPEPPSHDLGDVHDVCKIFDASLPVPAHLATIGSGMNVEQKNVPSASSSHSAPSWRSRCPPRGRCPGHWSPCGPPPPRPPCPPPPRPCTGPRSGSLRWQI